MQRPATLLTREPFVPFVVLGVTLYVTMLALRPAAPVETIEVPEVTIRALIEQSRQLYGRDLTAEEIAITVNDHVDSEVLLREARAQRLDQDDSRVRSRLLNVMRASLDEPVPEPSVAQLEAYYREHADRLRSSPSVTLEHVYFAWGSETPAADPAAFIETLEAESDPTALGEDYSLGNRYARADRRSLVLGFGPEFADAVPAIEPGRWTGPIESRAGIHYVRVIERHPPELLPFEDVEPYLRTEWVFEQRRATQQDKIAKLRARYRIVLPQEFVAGADGQ